MWTELVVLCCVVSCIQLRHRVTNLTSLELYFCSFAVEGATTPAPFIIVSPALHCIAVEFRPDGRCQLTAKALQIDTTL